MDRAPAGRDAEVSLIDRCVVVRFSSPPDTLESVADIVAAVAAAEAGRTRPVLWDTRRWPSGRAATWIRLVSTVKQLFSAAALLYDPAARPVIAEGATTSRSTVPFGVFTSEAEARAFLLAGAPSVGERSSKVHGVVETAATSIWYEDGIVFVRDKGGGPSTVEAAAEALAVIGQLVGDRPRPMLWDAQEWGGFPPDVWILVVSAIESLANGVAMVVNPERPPSNAFPEAISRFMIPYRVFTDSDAALDFLRSLEIRD